MPRSLPPCFRACFQVCPLCSIKVCSMVVRMLPFVTHGSEHASQYAPDHAPNHALMFRTILGGMSRTMPATMAHVLDYAHKHWANQPRRVHIMRRVFRSTIITCTNVITGICQSISLARQSRGPATALFEIVTETLCQNYVESHEQS